MVDVKQICGENDDSAEAADPEYELFFERLNKHEKSYVLEGKINDVFVCVKYEGESKFCKKHNPKCGRKMRKDIAPLDVAADQSPRLPNKLAPVNQHTSENAHDRRSAISKKKPDLRNKEIIKESDVGFPKALSKGMDNLGSGKVSKNITFVHENNIVTDNQSEPHGQARLRKADKGANVAKAHYVSDSKSVIQTSCDGNRYQSHDPRNNSESENQSEPVGQAQLIKRKKDLKGKNVVLGKHKPDTENHLFLKPNPKHNSATKYQVDHSEPHDQAQLRKSDKGEDVAKAHYPPENESVIWISCDGNRYQNRDPRNNSESDSQSEPIGQAQPIKRKKDLKGKNVVIRKHKLDTENHVFLKPDPKHNLVTKCQVDRANQVAPSEEAKEVQIKTNLRKMMDEKNVATDDFVANKKTLNYSDIEPPCLKPSPEKNMQEHQHEDVDRTQPGKKHKVQSQRKLRKVVHGSYEIKVDDATSRNGVALIENKSMFHKSCPRKYQVTKDCIDQARPKQSHSMFMKDIIDITDDSDSDIKILDSASLYREGNPGSFMTSNKFHKSVIEDDDVMSLGRTNQLLDFRRQIMEVLQKPYDKLETARLQEAFMAGSYVKFHPDVVRIVMKRRYQKGKCLAILRGFFFWLKNLTQEGSFKPWEDEECLGVDTTLL